MLWLAAYLTGFPPVGLHALSWTHGLAPMWSGLYIISTWNNIVALITLNECQCPLGLIPHFYLIELLMYRDLSSLCQCPLGLIPHFYLLAVCMVKIEELVSMPSRAYTSFLLTTLRSLIISMSVICVNALSGLYLISTMDTIVPEMMDLMLCQCPLGLIPHFYGTPSKT